PVDFGPERSRVRSSHPAHAPFDRARDRRPESLGAQGRGTSRPAASAAFIPRRCSQSLSGASQSGRQRHHPCPGQPPACRGGASGPRIARSERLAPLDRGAPPLGFPSAAGKDEKGKRRRRGREASSCAVRGLPRGQCRPAPGTTAVYANRSGASERAYAAAAELSSLGRAGPFAQDSGTGRCSSAIVAVGLAVAAAYGVILERARFGAWLALSAGIGGTASLARNVRAVLGLAASVARPAATGLF